MTTLAELTETYGLQYVPLDNSPNQTLQTTLSINNVNRTFTLFLRYIGAYWSMRVSENDVILVDNIALLSGANGYLYNILRGFEYLNIGSAYIFKTSTIISEVPDNTNLGTDFILLWGE